MSGARIITILKSRHLPEDRLRHLVAKTLRMSPQQIEAVLKTLPPPEPRKPGEKPLFTGTDSHGHEWRNGRQVAKPQEQGQGRQQRGPADVPRQKQTGAQQDKPAAEPPEVATARAGVSTALKAKGLPEDKLAKLTDIVQRMTPEQLEQVRKMAASMKSPETDRAVAEHNARAAAIEERKQKAASWKNDMLAKAKKAADEHFADDFNKGVAAKLEAAEKNAAAIQKVIVDAPSFEAVPAGYFDKRRGAEAEVDAIKRAIAHNSRRALMLAFMRPWEQRCFVNADSPRPNSDRAKKWQQASEYLEEFMTKDGPGNTYVSIRAAKNGRAYYHLGTLYTTDFDDPAIHAHEFGHHLEQAKWVKDRVAEFRKTRYDPSKDVPMREVDPQAGYGHDEIGNPDEMQGTFTADSNGSAAYAGKTYSDGQTEIVSMGIEQLYRDPMHFARSDPEYFALIMSVLQEPRT